MGFNTGPNGPMPIMDIHGTQDNTIPASCTGGQCGPNGSPISCDGYYYASVLQVMGVWGEVNRCSGPPLHYPTEFDGDLEFWCWSSQGNCELAPTVRCAHRGGHTWPFGTGGA